MNSVLMPPPVLEEREKDKEGQKKVVVQKLDPFGKAALREDLEHAVSHLLTYSFYLDQSQRQRLRDALDKLDPGKVGETTRTGQSSTEYGASFDLASEVQAQIDAVRAVRSTVMAPGGQILPGVSSREAKEVISSGSTLLGTLMKFHEKVVNMDRLRKLESAMLEVLQEVDPQLQEQVLDKLERRLSAGAT